MRKAWWMFALMIALLPAWSSAQETTETPKSQPPTAAEIAALSQEAAKHFQERKFEEARAAYEKLLAALPAGDAAAVVVRYEIARTLLAEENYVEGIKHLQKLLGGKEELPPKLFEEARNQISHVRLALGRKLREGSKFDEAIPVLQQIVTDKHATPTYVRQALRDIAASHVSAKRNDAAVAVYRQLLKRPPVSESATLEDLLALAELDPSSVSGLQTFLDEHPAASADLLSQAKLGIGRALLKQGETAQALTVFDKLATSKETPPRWVRGALMGKAEAALAKGETAQAAAFYRNITGRPVGDWGNAWHERLADIDRLAQLDPRGDVANEYAIYLNHLVHVSQLGLHRAVPGNDALRLAPPPDINALLAGYRTHLRQTTGRAAPAAVEAIRVQLTEGGDARPFVATPFSKRVAAKISPASPTGEFFKPLLLGDYQRAAQVAWNRARLAENETERRQWLYALAAAVRCHDQRLAGRNEAFAKWLTDESADSENPLAGLLSDQPLAFEPTEEAFARALTQLNSARAPQEINAQQVVRLTLPKNDVLQMGWQTADAALQNYRRHQWRTAGRASAAELDQVAAQLAQGGAARPFVVSGVSERLARGVLDDAPLAGYLRPLLTGEHLAAAQAAWKQARLAADPQAYAGWIEAAAVALRCHDQSYVRGEELIVWSRGVGVPALTRENEEAVPAGPLEPLTLEPLPHATDPKVAKQVIDELNKLTDITRLDLKDIVPGDDVLLAVTNIWRIGHNDNRWLIYTRALWRTRGRALPAEREAMITQLTQGGSARPFVVSEETKRLAEKVSPDAPLAGYLKPLLEGKFQEAAQFAWRKAREAADDNGYNAWVQGVILAGRCHEQTVAGRAGAFAQWTQGTLKDAQGEPVMENPLAEFLGD